MVTGTLKSETMRRTMASCCASFCRSRHGRRRRHSAA
jgi:hypothetical protein